jgi:Ca-activated chloride channel family protein
MNLTWARPDLLALIVLLPIIVAVGVMMYARRRRRVADALGQQQLVRRLGAGDLRRFPVLRALLLTLAAACLGVAVAGPRWGTERVETRSRAFNLVLALDVSRSMLSRDVQPSRLEREKLLARQLLRELGSDRLGLVAFAGRSYVLSPLTTDHAALELFVDAADPDIVSQGGTSVAAALAQAADLARGDDRAGGDRAIVLVTDGEALEEEGDVIAAADRAAQLGVKVHAVGIGTPQGSPIPDRDPNTGRVLGYKRDENGDVVISRLDESLLKDIARRTHGTYVNLEEPGATAALLSTLRQMNRAPVQGGRSTQDKEQFAWFAGAALLLLALDTLTNRRAALARRDDQQAHDDAPHAASANMPKEVAV